jgi:hypothetical protein
MRKLSEIQNEDALDVIADMIDPIMEICKDEEVKANASKPKAELVKVILKKHKSAIIKMFAVLDGEPIETYKVNIVQIPSKLLEMLNDENIAAFFELQGLKISDASFGSVTENTEEIETK